MHEIEHGCQGQGRRSHNLELFLFEALLALSNDLTSRYKTVSLHLTTLVLVLFVSSPSSQLALYHPACLTAQWLLLLGTARPSSLTTPLPGTPGPGSTRHGVRTSDRLSISYFVEKNVTLSRNCPTVRAPLPIIFSLLVVGSRMTKMNP